MSFLDRIQAVNGYDPTGFRAFRVDGVQVGAIKHGFAEILSRWPAAFRVEDNDVSIPRELDSPELRTQVVNEALLTLRDEGFIPGWRNEPYPINRSYTDTPYLLMERAAIPFFGARAYGVHLNGFVRDRGGLKMWIGRRARDAHNEPGKLDQMVAGGQPAGLSLKANVMKECWEEAGIPTHIAELATPVGAIGYCRETSYGLKPDTIYNFDLELAPDS